MSAVAVAACAAACALLAGWQRRAWQQQATARRAVFDGCDDLLSAATLGEPGSDYPCLRGCYQGRRVEIQPLLDHIGFRKVPSLWLSVTLLEALPIAGAFDLLMRPRNIEFFSPSSRLPERVELPDGWPQDHLAKVSPRGWLPPLAAIGEAASEWLSRVEFKELLVTPNGTRLVARLGGVERSGFLVLRSLRPECETVPRAMLQSLLDTALRVGAAVGRPTPGLAS